MISGCFLGRVLAILVHSSLSLADYKLNINLIHVAVPDMRNYEGINCMSYSGAVHCQLRIPYLCVESLDNVSASDFDDCSGQSFSLLPNYTAKNDSFSFTRGQYGNWMNPSEITLTGPWKGGQLKMGIEDWDKYVGPTPVDNITVPLNTSSFPLGTGPQHVIHMNKRSCCDEPHWCCEDTIFTFEVSVRCANGYTGRDCQIPPPPPKFGDCDVSELNLCDKLKSGHKSGTYNSSLLCGVLRSFEVFCDMESGGGGWTLFQRRDVSASPALSFDRNWAAYEGGFGRVSGAHWRGLAFLSAATKLPHSHRSLLRLDLWDCRYNHRYIVYRGFKVHGPATNFTLSLGSVVEGDVGDSFFGASWAPWLSQNNSAFSTADADHDGSLYDNCAAERGGGFWFSGCGGANLNGRHKADCWYSGSDGVRWSAIDTVTAGVQSLPHVEMKFKYVP